MNRLPETLTSLALLTLSAGALWLGHRWMTLVESDPGGDEDDSGPWYSARAECEVCAHRWVAVYPAGPAGPTELQCPHCEQMTTAPHLED